MKPFCSIGGLGIVSFYPPVETGGSCRIPSPPPYPTESCHLCRLALMRFAVMTSIMQDLLNLFKRLRRSFEGFIFFVAFPWVSCGSGAANAPTLQARRELRCPLKRQLKSALSYLCPNLHFHQLSRTRKHHWTRSSRLPPRRQTKSVIVNR